ncbi:unnamed protein product, partial [Choristocarpus tenellus]
PCANLLVARLEAEFIVDDDGHAWFSHPLEIMVQRRVPTHLQVEAEVAEGCEVEEHEVRHAVAAAQNLKKLLGLSYRRGLEVADAFRHFDPNKRGVAGQQELREGMRRLGVNL